MSRSKWLVPILGFLVLAGCRQDMHNQPRYEPLQASTLFADGRAARPLIEGTVPRGGLKHDRQLFTGRRGLVPAVQTAAAPALQPPAPTGGATFSFDPDLVTEFPMPVTREVIQRGRERFNIYCTPCHGYTGSGNGMIVQRGLSKPPSYHITRLREAPAGHFFDVITNGFGAMYSYASRVSVNDRWAIVAYIRALQLSQGATADDVPQDERAKLALAPNSAESQAGGGTAPSQIRITPPPKGQR